MVLQPIQTELKQQDGTVFSPARYSTKVEAFVFKKAITSGNNTNFAAVQAGAYVKPFVDTLEADVLGGNAQGNDEGSNIE